MPITTGSKLSVAPAASTGAPGGQPLPLKDDKNSGHFFKPQKLPPKPMGKKFLHVILITAALIILTEACEWYKREQQRETAKSCFENEMMRQTEECRQIISQFHCEMNGESPGIVTTGIHIIDKLLNWAYARIPFAIVRAFAIARAFDFGVDIYSYLFPASDGGKSSPKAAGTGTESNTARVTNAHTFYPNGAAALIPSDTKKKLEASELETQGSRKPDPPQDSPRSQEVRQKTESKTRTKRSQEEEEEESPQANRREGLRPQKKKKKGNR